MNAMVHAELRYSERRSRPELQNWIQSLWTFDASALAASPYEHFVPPDGCVSILAMRHAGFSAESLILVGPRWEPHRVPVNRGDSYDGVRFWPFAARALLGEMLPPVVGRIEPLIGLLPDLARRIHAAVARTAAGELPPFHLAIQEELSAALPEANGVDSLVREATARIITSGGRGAISAIATDLGIGLRQLQRRFKHVTGLSLKQFARIRRFREAAGELLRSSPRPWCRVALDAGYADQAHLTREFSQLIGLSAKELEAKHKAILHDSVEP
jgi:AraC-like DNA-binding protein